MEETTTDVTTETDNSTESSTETTDTDQTGASDQNQNQADNKTGDDKKDNFADHPRWKEREDDWTKRFNEQEGRHVSEIEKLRQEFQSRFPADAAKPVEIPSWFGGDEKAWAMYQEYETQRLAKIREETINEFTKRTTAEQKRIDEATAHFNNAVAEIEADKTANPEGLKIDRNKLLKIAEDNELVDTKGRWNYKAAFKLMKPAEVFQAKAALDEKKKFANATNSDNRAEDKPGNFKTSDDFKGKSWDSI